MTLRERLLAEPDPRERHRIKAEAFAALASLAGQSWKRGRLTATVIDGPHLRAAIRAVELSVRITRDGVDITPSSLNPLLYVNLPILVPDPAGDVVRASTDPDGTVTERRFREDPRAALLIALRETLRGALGG